MKRSNNNTHIILHRFALIFLLLLVLFVAFAPADSKKKIKKQVEKGYIPGEGKSLVYDGFQRTKLFDSTGNLLKEIYTREDAVEKKTVNIVRQYYYSEKGRCDSMTLYNDEKFSLMLGYKYNKEGRVTEIQEFNLQREPSFKTKLFYDSAGNKVKEKLFDKENKLYNFKDYTYNSRGNLIKESGTELGTPRYNWKYVYDKKRLLAERKEYSGDNELRRKRRYEYDKEGFLILEKQLTPQDVLERVIKYEYEFY